MSSFLRIHSHVFQDDDDEDEDYEICDFAKKRVELDLNANDSNIAGNTRSKVQLPKHKQDTNATQYERDEDYARFLKTLYDAPGDEEQDEDFELNENSVSPSKLREDYDDHAIMISRRELKDLTAFQENSNSSHSASLQFEQHSNNKKVTPHIRVPFHQKQRHMIRQQLKQLFQLLVIVRHLSLNEDEATHATATQLLYAYNCSRLGAIQSIRFAMAKQSGAFSSFDTENISQQQANQIALLTTKHCKIDSMMDVAGCDEYFQFNQHVCRSYAAVLNRFRGSLLEEKYIPIQDHFGFAQRRNVKDEQFTETEEKLLGLGVKEYGKVLKEAVISNENIGMSQNVMINDWTSLRNRFLPHKNIPSLQKRIGKIRKLSHKLKYDYRLRSTGKHMTDIELGLLVKGVEKYGKKSWTKISKEFLPNWTPREIKNRYSSKLQPLIETMKRNVQWNTDKIMFFNPSMDEGSLPYSHRPGMQRIHHNHNHNHHQSKQHKNRNDNDRQQVQTLHPLFCNGPTCTDSAQNNELLSCPQSDDNVPVQPFDNMQSDTINELRMLFEEELKKNDGH
eukprot:CAMPEP_0197077398 /NCGR_PEP_ID=MMETSP1384-20130603/212602_1 /TAXON_ID=29189 /ORGANISM="Ammonia sp." /LENGTH=562 /DNA_ID=CAMNT_0042516265 /DNA_START=26 /DNA_END=1714 /DNA_ORIENTATION=+